MKKIAGVILVILIFTSSVFAKDLSGRFGAGFNSELNGALNSLSMKYWLNQKLGLQGLVGVAIATNNTIFDVGGKFYYNMLTEENLNLALVCGAGLDINSVTVAAVSTTTTTFRALTGIGFEYFLAGLPNLGFATEIGLGFSSGGGSTAFGTTAAGFSSAVGIHYYFGK